MYTGQDTQDEDTLVPGRTNSNKHASSQCLDPIILAGQDLYPLVSLTQGGPTEDTLPAAVSKEPLALNQHDRLPHLGNVLHTLVSGVGEVSVTQSVCIKLGMRMDCLQSKHTCWNW